ncbi:MAG: serine hydrolase [Pseudomonadota bacterium]
MGEKLDLGLRSGLLDGFHGLIVERHGVRVLERYQPGKDWTWGRDLGEVDHGPTTLHDLRSVSKSVTSLVYAIAAAEGKAPPPEANLLDQFPAYTDLAADPQRAAWTVQHVLDMVLGTQWNEDLPYTDPRNSEIAMERADDRYRFVLERPIIGEPGTRWQYSGGCSALLGALIERGTGMPLDAYAAETLFGPLGIERFEWMKGADGVASPASGLRLTLPDLAKLGRLFLAKGEWEGRQIVPADWIAACSTPSVPSSRGRFYSRQWHLHREIIPATGSMAPFIAAVGNGGQRLFIAPSLDLVIALTGGNYNTPSQWIVPTLVLRNIVLANIERV